MNLVTTYFTVKRIAGSHFMGEPTLKYQQQRQQEYVDCLARNLLHPAVASVVLLVEGLDAYAHLVHTFHLPRVTALTAQSQRELCPLLSMKPHVREEQMTMGATDPVSPMAHHGLRDEHMRKLVPVLYTPSLRWNPTGKPLPTYADLFHCANQLLPGRLAMVCNADIHLSHHGFDKEVVSALFAKEAPAQRLALALTRYETDDSGKATLPLSQRAPLIHDYRGSHDAFVVRPPVPDHLLAGVTHLQNCYQAENIVIHELRRAGYTVLNPCLDLRVVHHHAADVRQWLPSVDPSRYGRAAPTTLAECFSHLKG